MSLTGRLSAAVAVDRDDDLLGVERQRVLDEDEAPARLGFLAHLLGQFVDLARVAGGLDDQRDRQAAAGAGQRRRGEDQRLDTGYGGEPRLDVLLYLGLGTVALRPVLECPQRDAGIGLAAEADD
jgi:hypothetical protein